MPHAHQQCVHPDCQTTYDVGQILTACPKCGSLLDIAYDWDKIAVPSKLADFEKRWSNRLHPLDYSGVWRFRELLSFPDDKDIVTIGQGQTLLQKNDRWSKLLQMNPRSLYLHYEALNPFARFKDLTLIQI